jgi:hypothetical protein
LIRFGSGSGFIESESTTLLATCKVSAIPQGRAYLLFLLRSLAPGRGSGTNPPLWRSSCSDSSRAKQ